MSNKIIVISDLHVGGGPLDDCDQDLENCLVSFVNGLAVDDCSVELVINGDFLDFVQAPPWKGRELESVTPLGIPLCFTQDQSLEKLNAILTAHSEIFLSLGRFLEKNPENRIVIIPGNHDVDFFWERVRTVFSDAVSDCTALRKRISFHLERVYKPNACPRVWIEHGHQYDPINSFFIDQYDPEVGNHIGKRLFWNEQAPPILLDKNGTKRLFQCLGTKFLIKYINELDSYYPFVDNVKPFSRFLRIFCASVFSAGYGPIKATLAVWGIIKYLSELSLIDPSGMLSNTEMGDNGIVNALRERLEALSIRQRKEFSKKIRERGFPLDQPLLMYFHDPSVSIELITFLSNNLDLTDPLTEVANSYLDLKSADGYLTTIRGYNVNETLELRKAAQNIREREDIDLVIMGHTHEPVKGPVEAGYLNTGSWTRYYQADDNRLRPWSALERDAQKDFPYELNYVEIAPDRQPQGRFMTYLKES